MAVVTVVLPGFLFRDTFFVLVQIAAVFIIGTDHIVVFDGTERLIGQTELVKVDDASPFTLYGEVVTNELVGASREQEPPLVPERSPTFLARPDGDGPSNSRIPLPQV